MQDWLYRGGWCYNCWGFEKEFWGYRSSHSSSCWLSFEHSSTDGYKVAVRRNVGFLVVGRGEVFLKCSKRVLWRSFCSPPLFQCQSSLLTFLLVSWSESWRYLAYIYWGGLGGGVETLPCDCGPGRVACIIWLVHLVGLNLMGCKHEWAHNVCVPF